MGFAAEFELWLREVLLNFISDNLEHLAESLTPVVVALATLYLIGYGVLLLTGQVEAPLQETFKRFAVIAGIFGVAIQLWLYQSVIVATFFDGPRELAAVFVGAFEPVTIVDQIIFSGGDIAALLMAKGGLLNGNFAFYLVGFFTYIVVAGTAIYVLYLLTLSRVGLAVLLALGPLFLALLFFKSTSRFCGSWLAQLSNYALVAILTVLIAALMLHVLSVETTRAMNEGGEIQIADAMRVCLAAGLTSLILRQVLTLAASLSNGVALQSYNLLSRTVDWGIDGYSRRRALRRWESKNTRAIPHPAMRARFGTAGPSRGRSARRNEIRVLDGLKVGGTRS